MTSRCEFCGRELPRKNFALVGHAPMLITFPCDCPEAQAEARRESEKIELEERAEAFKEAWRRVGVPAMFSRIDADFEDARPLFEDRSLYIVGDNGRGKTHTACRVAKAYLVRNTKRRGVTMRCWKSCLFVTAQDVLSQLKRSWVRWDQSEEDVFQRWAGVGLLVLDDLGKGVPSEWAAENFFRLVDARWSNQRPMVITSQYSMSDLSDRFEKAGDETMAALASRLRGWCDEMAMSGPDRRLAGA